MKLEIFDSTLRDGAQGEGVSFSVEDKLKILKRLDAFGVDFTEAGNPGSNPKDLEFFGKAAQLTLNRARLVAFGSTKRKGLSPENDEQLNALLSAGTKHVAVFGKSWDLHAECILRATLEENLAMIRETIAYLTAKGRTVLFDAEHFFDGYKNNADYALQTVKTAAAAGAGTVVLCDTNGGCFPDEVAAITAAVKTALNGVKIGIHCHNDTDCAVANSIAAVKSGCEQVQGTFIGMGERCGNANLSALIPNLQLKLGYDCVPAESMAALAETARFIAEVANIRLTRNMPYVGGSAFAHKGGMHTDGVSKNPVTFEHIPPESVGNERNILLSEVSGRSSLMVKLEKIAPNIDKNNPVLTRIIDKIKGLEHEGYQFEAAEASFELLVLKELGLFIPFFDIIDFKIVVSHSENTEFDLKSGYGKASAMIKVRVRDVYEITADEGDGPVNAIDRALRKALGVFYPALNEMRLTDYKVRIINSGDNTAATTRVLIESTDGLNNWITVGAGRDIINASMIALVDSLEYMLYNNMKRQSD